MCLDKVISEVSGRRRGFTLIELLVVIAIIAILAAVLLPVLHQAQLRGETAACIDHQKQLATAWVMYSSDNNDYCAGNAWTNEQNWTQFRGRFSPAGPITTPQNWISGWLDPAQVDPNNVASLPNGDSDNTNSDILTDSHYASLGDYVKNAGIFICPSSTIKVDSVQGKDRSFNEIRSVSMNCWVGYVCAPGQSQSLYKAFSKVTTITAGIGPADLFVFMEERGESIDDGSFETDMANSSDMANFPTDYHNDAATIGFADGHVDVHRWVNDSYSQGWSCTAPQDPEPSVKWNFGTATTTKANILWLESHASISLVP